MLRGNMPLLASLVNQAHIVSFAIELHLSWCRACEQPNIVTYLFPRKFTLATIYEQR